MSKKRRDRRAHARIELSQNRTFYLESAHDSDAAQLEFASGQDTLPTFSAVAYSGAVLTMHGQQIVVDLAGLSLPKQGLAILRQHDPDRIVGHSTSIEKTQQRLRVQGYLSAGNEWAEEVRSLAANGFPWQLSIGATIEEAEQLQSGKKATVNGRVVLGPAAILRRTTLKEISFVPVGADSNTSASIAASFFQSERIRDMDFAQWLKKEFEFEEHEISDAQREKLMLRYRAELAPKAAPSSDVGAAMSDLDEVLNKRKRERERHDKIVELTDKFMAMFNGNVHERIEAMARKALEDGTSPEMFELQCRADLRNENMVSAIHGADMSLPSDAAVIEAALCKAMRLSNLEQSYSSRVLEMADRQWPHHLSLGEFLLSAARKNGYRGISLNASSCREVLTYALGDDLRLSGPSTYSVPGILSNVLGKVLLSSFMAVDNAWSQIASIRSVRDFKQITSYSLQADMTYQRVAPGGQLKHGEISELVYTNQANTYGRLFAIDRRDLINDDLGAFDSIGRQLGRGGANAINDLFWATFLGAEAADFFHTDNNNLITEDLSIDGLIAADTAFHLQTKPDGSPLGIMPSLLVVPTALRFQAARLMGAPSVVVAGDTDVQLPSMNPLQGMFKVVSSAYMSSSKFTGNSGAAWYLLADPNELAMIEMCFVGGQQTPTIETVEMAHDRLGLVVRAYHDFGCALQEYRAAIKSDPNG